jgi:hypothetical protein
VPDSSPPPAPSPVPTPPSGGPADTPASWASPSTSSPASQAVGAPAGAHGGAPAGGPVGAWQAGVPLGGVQPQPVAEAAPSQRKDLLLTAVLLVAALAAGATSLLSWRDVGGLAGGVETGWREFDGGLGRGWVAVLGGVLLAVAGVLVAAEKGRLGRVLAVLTGVGLMVFSVLEWGLGLRNVRTGPGPGLWMLFVVGMLVVIAVGALAPDPPARTERSGR